MDIAESFVVVDLYVIFIQGFTKLGLLIGHDAIFDQAKRNDRCKGYEHRDGFLGRKRKKV